MRKVLIGGLGFMAALKAALVAGHIADAPQLAQLAADQRQSRGYPEWRSRRKTRGKRDASLRARSNRRKAAR